MTPWTIVALAGIICLCFTVCWALWVTAVYDKTNEPDEIEIDDTEAITRSWPAVDEQS